MPGRRFGYHLGMPGAPLRGTLAAVALAAVALAAVAAGCDGDEPGDSGAPPSTGGPPPATAPAPLLGVVSPPDGSAPVLTRLDPRSLEPRGPSLELGEYHDAWSFSPDGSQVALGMGGPGRETCGAGICIVDAESMKVRADVEAPVAAEAVAWLTPRRVAAVLQSGELVVADAHSGRTLKRASLTAGPVLSPPVALWRGRLVALVAGADGAAQIVTADAQGTVRSAKLSGIGLRAGPELPPPRPALSVDPRRPRALVVGAGAPAAEVDLRSMRVRRHPLPAPASGAAPDGPRSSTRHAVWLGRDLVAVAGEDVVGASGGERRLPAGVQLVDTHTWRARLLEPRASRARLADGRLVVHTQPPSAEGVGLRLYTGDGARLEHHLLGGAALDVQVAGPFAYALAGDSVHVVDITSAEVVRRPDAGRAEGLELLGSRLGTGGHAG